MENPKSLDDFAIFLSECEQAVKDIDALKVLEYTDNFRKIVSKLPYQLHDKWRSVVHESKEKGKRPSFSTLVKFVSKEAKKSNDPTFGRDAMLMDNKHQGKAATSSKNQRTKGSFATKMVNVNDEQSEPTIKPKPNPATTQVQDSKQSAFTAPCMYCNGLHTLEFCQNFPLLNYYDRTNFLKSKRHCFGCLKFGHMSRFCRNRANCNHCKGRHPSILHVEGTFPPPKPEVKEENPGPDSSKSNLITSVSLNVADHIECTMAIIPVKVKLHGSSEVHITYAFLDPGSNISFCTETLMNRLGAEGKKRKLVMDTMGEQFTMETYEVPNIEIMDLEQKNTVQLPIVYTKNKMPVSKTHIPTSADMKQWPHLEDIRFPVFDREVEILIGNNIPDAYAPMETRVGPRGTPHATYTTLGWIPWNVFRMGGSNLNTVNRVDVTIIENAQETDNLNELYIKSVNMDFPEKLIDCKKEYSVQDHLFLNKMSESKKYTDDHYEFCLPFKNSIQRLPDNQFVAKQRLTSLKRRLQSDSHLHKDYNDFMQMIIDRNFAEEVPTSEIQRSDGKVWYLPHHGVYHAKKKKLRVVFDCSSRFKGISLNDSLLQGPNLTASLIGVMIRFRQEPTAVMGDIEKMFYQVRVSPEDRDCLRFFWWPQGDLQLQPSLYRMTVHLFGAVSSPSCSSYALGLTIQENKHLFNPSVSEYAHSSFYVDDFLCSVSEENEAITLIEQVTSLCMKGGFHLTKWVTNSKRVFDSIPEEEKGMDLVNLDLDPLPTDRALGVLWDLQTDSVGFPIEMKHCPATRRNILSIVASVYDPHGLVSPFTLIAKILLQDLCKRAVEWDAPLCEKDESQWNNWISGLSELQNIRIQRCFKSDKLNKIQRVEIHHFCDASEVGYGTASYLRFIDICGLVHCVLLFGKSRVAPLKKISIPRMELAAATLAVKMNNVITTELRYNIDQIYYWTDSMAVLRYIANESTRFHTFVANRLTVIREGSSLDQWHFIDGNANPADLASRGVKPNDVRFQQWLNGPDFLFSSESQWSSVSGNEMHIQENDPEIKKMCNATIECIEQKQHVIDELLRRYSNLNRIIRIIAWVLKYKEQLCQRVLTKDPHKVPCEGNKNCKTIVLTLDDLEKAEKTVVCHVQHQYFQEEISILSKGCPDSIVKKSSSIYKLDPYIENGIMRVGGRLEKSDLPYNAKHQILIPKESPYAKLLLLHIHQTVGHQGKNAMLSKLREKYWIPQSSSLIKDMVSRCVTCRKYSAKSCSQKMSDLPKDRVVPDEAPFSHSGMDYFGPFSIKRGRSTVKRYGVLFTCLTSRAVHLEVAHSLDMDSCINAIRRFKSRRGHIKSITSDNGTNLVGSERELKQSIEEWNQSKLTKDLQQENITWHFNPPTASHFGGVWERLIRSVRKILYALLKEQTGSIDDESLCTLFCEIEQILNNRPITPLSDDINDVRALTPNDLLLVRPEHGLPPGLFDKNDNYTRRRWRKVQYLANLFWKRWHRDYLPLLQQCQKWLKPQHNLSVGDIVLLIENSPRSSWPLARVVDIHSDDKGRVRVVTVKTAISTLQRPIHKLCLVLEADKM